MQNNQFQSYGNAMEIKGRNWHGVANPFILIVFLYSAVVISIIRKDISINSIIENFLTFAIIFISLTTIAIIVIYLSYQERTLIIDDYGIRYFVGEKIKFDGNWIEIKKIFLYPQKRGKYYSNFIEMETQNKKISINAYNFDTNLLNVNDNDFGKKKIRNAIEKIKEYQSKYKFEFINNLDKL